MASRSQYEELGRHLSAIGSVKRELARGLPVDCPPASAGVLALLEKYGEMRTSQLAELLAIDMSVTSRHVAHVAERGWIEKHPDPLDGRSRLLRISEQGQRQLNLLSERTTEALERHLGDWSDEDVERLTSLLERLRSSFSCENRAERGAGDRTEGPAARAEKTR
ncbi:MarR family winged helix-turn-helix transcriptional regulator [Streptomyces sp. ODS28]|uniref:MarR family winged helix-turn-helix transcriptional regulator n=1 Tax=Streptomyces sp. ODS28 TaxID=3136688 RepID=UPI0031EBC0F1